MERFDLGNRVLYYWQTLQGGLVFDFIQIVFIGALLFSLSGIGVWICVFLLILCLIDLTSITINKTRFFFPEKYFIVDDSGIELKQTIFPKENFSWNDIGSIEMIRRKVMIGQKGQTKTKIDISELREAEVRELDAVLYRYCNVHHVIYTSSLK